MNKSIIYLFCFVFISAILLIQPIHAQPNIRRPVPVLPETGTECDGDDEQILWEDVNGYRAQLNLMPVAFSNQLCQVAEDHLRDLLPRTDIDTRTQRLDGTFLNDWLTEVGYFAYPGYQGGNYGEFVADIFVWVAPEIAPDGDPDIVEFLRNRLDLTGFYGHLINPNYREIGIAHREALGLNNVVNHYYVFIFASHPNRHPIIPVSFRNTPPPNWNQVYPYRGYAYETIDQRIGLLFHSENIDGYEQGFLYRDANQNLADAIGQVRYVRRASSPTDFQVCPIPSGEIPENWFEFPLPNTTAYSFTLTGNAGMNNLHFQLCDGAQNGIISSVRVDYIGTGSIPPTSIPPTVEPVATTAIPATDIIVTPTATVDIIGIARATFEAEQTATTISVSETADILGITQTIQAEQTRLNAVTSTIAPPTADAQVATNAQATAVAQATTNAQATAVAQATTTDEEIDIPFDELTLFWNSEIFILYNPNSYSIGLDYIANISLVNPENGNEFRAAWWLTHTTSTELLSGRCMVVYDSVQPTLEEVNDFRDECPTNVEDFTSIIAATDPERREMVWYYGGTRFEVYYNDVLIKTCITVNTFECDVTVP